MDGIVELAVLVGRLEHRIEELEKRLQQIKQPAPQDPPDVIATFRGKPVEGPIDDVTPDKLLQQGIDNIMGYQWPPRKEGD